MENDIIKNKTNENYITGIIGAIIGGLIGSIPWILVYVYGNLIVSLLATIIALGALKGYQLFKGKITKAIKPIIVIITLLIVVFVNLVVVPYFISYSNDMDLSYIYSNLQDELMHDLLLSILFAILGIGISISYINKTLIENNAINDKEDILNKSETLKQAQIDSQLKSEDKQNLDMVRKIFNELNATSKNSAIEKELILEKLTCENPEKLFKKYKTLDVIRKYKGKYYYQSKNEIFLTKNYWIWFVIFITIMVFVNIYNDDTNYNTTYDNDSSYLESSTTYSDYTFANDTLQITPALNWSITEETYDSITLQSSNGNSALSIYFYDTDDFADDISLDEINTNEIEALEEYYSLESDELVTEKYKILENEAYKYSFDSLSEGYKISGNFYVVKTDKYLIEISAISLRSKAETYLTVCEEMVNSLKEL